MDDLIEFRLDLPIELPLRCPLPELEVLLGTHVLEEQSFIAKLARDQFSLEVDVSDVLWRGIDVSEAVDFEDLGTFLAYLEKVLPPSVRRVLVALERTRKVELIRCDNIVIIELLGLVILSKVANGCGEGPFVALGHLRNDSVEQVLIVVTLLVCGLERLHTVLHRVIEEVPRVGLEEAGHAEDVLGLGVVSEGLYGQ